MYFQGNEGLEKSYCQEEDQIDVCWIVGLSHISSSRLAASKAQNVSLLHLEMDTNLSEQMEKKLLFWLLFCFISLNNTLRINRVYSYFLLLTVEISTGPWKMRIIKIQICFWMQILSTVCLIQKPWNHIFISIILKSGIRIISILSLDLITFEIAVSLNNNLSTQMWYWPIDV